MMNRLIGKGIVTALGLTLVTVPLTGCLGMGASEDDGPASVTATAEDDFEETVRTPTGSADISTWKTLGDAFAAAEEDPNYGYDERYYLAILVAGGKHVRVTARMTPEVYNALSDIDVTSADATRQGEDALSQLEINTVDEIESKRLTEEQLQGFVGKTGQDLVNAGLTFETYTMYGTPDGIAETGADFSDGLWSYGFTFEVNTPETVVDDYEHAGENLMGAKVISVETDFVNTSSDALDPDKFAKESEGVATGEAQGTPDATAQATQETPTEMDNRVVPAA